MIESRNIDFTIGGKNNEITYCCVAFDCGNTVFLICCKIWESTVFSSYGIKEKWVFLIIPSLFYCKGPYIKDVKQK